MFDNNSVYLLSAHSIRFDAHGANYYYPSYARPSQRRTRQTRKNPTSTHLLHLGRERQLLRGKVNCAQCTRTVNSQGYNNKQHDNELTINWYIIIFKPHLLAIYM